MQQIGGDSATPGHTHAIGLRRISRICTTLTTCLVRRLWLTLQDNLDMNNRRFSHYARSDLGLIIIMIIIDNSIYANSYTQTGHSATSTRMPFGSQIPEEGQSETRRRSLIYLMVIMHCLPLSFGFPEVRLARKIWLDKYEY